MNLLEHLYLCEIQRGEDASTAFVVALHNHKHFQDKAPGLPVPENPFPGPMGAVPLSSSVPAAEEELRWRTVQTWEAHLAENNAFFQAENGVVPSVQPTMTPDIRKDIRDALKLFDAHLLTPDKREEWKRNSKVRAAGVGIYLSPHHTGTSKDNNVKDGGTRYLEHWRPWRHQRGKPSKIEEFAQLYFEARDVRS